MLRRSRLNATWERHIPAARLNLHHYNTVWEIQRCSPLCVIPGKMDTMWKKEVRGHGFSFPHERWSEISPCCLTAKDIEHKKNSRYIDAPLKCSNLWKEDKSFDHIFVIQSASVVPWKELLKKKNQFLKGSLIRWHSDLRGQTKQSHKDHRAVSHPLAARLPLLHLQLSHPPLRHRGNFPSISSPLVLSLHQQPCGQARRIVDITKWLNSEDDRSPEELQNDSVFLYLCKHPLYSWHFWWTKNFICKSMLPVGEAIETRFSLNPPKCVAMSMEIRIQLLINVKKVSAVTKSAFLAMLLENPQGNFSHRLTTIDTEWVSEWVLVFKLKLQIFM